MMHPQWINIETAAEITGLCTRTMRRFAAAGELPAYKVGRSLRFRLDEVTAFMESRRLPSANCGRARSTRGGGR
jgi:excisionase family DNA binding protein